MIDTKHLEALAAVIAEQSFDKAAKRLFLTQSAISQRIRQLEERIGHMLVVRSVPVQATPAGMAVLRHHRQLSMLEQNLFEELGSEGAIAQETVTLAVNADSLDTWFLPSVSDLLADNRILLDLVVDDQSVTHAYLRSGEVQGAITSTPAAFQGLVTHDLGDMEYNCVATPAFRDRYFPNGLDEAGAATAPMVIYNHKDQLQHEYLRQCLGTELNPPAHYMPSNISFQGIIKAGSAYGMVASFLAAPAIASGELVNLTPGRTLRVPHYYQCWTLQTRLARQVSETIVTRARECLSPREEECWASPAPRKGHAP